MEENKGALWVARLDQGVYYLTCCYMAVICFSKYHLQFFIVTAAVLGVIRYMIQRPKIELHTKHFYYVLIFYFFTALTVFLNDVNADYIKNLDTFRAHYINTLITAAVVFFFIREREKVKWLFVWLAASFFVNNLVAAAQHFQGIERVFGLTDRYMDLAGILIILAPVVLIYALDKKYGKIAKRIFYAATIVTLPAVFFSGTRIVWIVLALLFLFILGTLLQDKKKFVLICLGIFLVGTAAFACVPSEKARFFTIGDMEYQSNKERTLIWRSAANMFMEHPWAGVGFGNYTQQYRTHYILPEAKERMQYHAHNIYLQILAETGIFAFIAYMAMMAYFLYESLRRWLREKNMDAFVFFCVTVAISLHALTDANILFKVGFKVYALLLVMYLIVSGGVTYRTDKHLKAKSEGGK